MRCAYHVGTDMLILERKPAPRTKHRGPGDRDAEQLGSMAVCPIKGCPWVAEVWDERTVRLSKGNRTAVRMA